MTQGHQRGQSGEQTAAQFLKRCGYRLIQTNFRALGAEVDIIAREKDVLCFIEVKTRATACYGSAWEAVTPFKQRQLIKAARAFLSRYPQADWKVRFDVVAVQIDGPAQPSRVELLRNAFTVSEHTL